MICLFFGLSIVSCFFTYLLFSNVDLYGRSSKTVISILYFDVVLILVLLFLSSNKIASLWNSRRNKGSRLTLRLVSIFSLLAVVPSVMMSIFSAIFFHNGVEAWFNERNQTVLQESLSVAESYLAEHRRNALADCMAISKTLEYHLDKIPDEGFLRLGKDINFLLDDLCGLKGVDSAVLLDASYNVISHSKYSVNLHFLNVTQEEIQKLEFCDRKGTIIGNGSENQNSIIAASCFKHFDDYMYLIIEKNVDSTVVSHARNTRVAYDEYYQLLRERSSLEIAFILMFLIVGVLLLIASISIAVIYSWEIIKPVSNLIDVSEDIIAGNLKARAREDGAYEEIRVLSKTFNQMIDQVHHQRKDLISINQKLDERMKFTSSVLAGVSSGVIGVDNDAIYIWNNASGKLLGQKITYGEHIENIMPGIDELLSAVNQHNPYVEKEIQYKKGQDVLLFLVRIENITRGNDNRFVITFDDLTNMVKEQRKAAWTEAARRVAHEIKNPLTPIQLSAERIKRKYLSQISEDVETFSELVEVIIRQVGDIKRLIDEFNFFARLPEPSFKKCDLGEICEQAVFLMQNAGSDVEIQLLRGDGNYQLRADERLIHQSIINLIQNAINALSSVVKDNKKVRLSIQINGNMVSVLVEDNGPGLPSEKIESLAVPYFTLMPKGTGLGLAIVKKIIQDHTGELSFGDSELGGAKVVMSFPLLVDDKDER
ncbi:MAG: GHKL domain-containing protein [Holosporaceae bacterium]|nr:GHKL domain-containing protein [Holosporaceae bacterium]